ncbi:tape measure protein [Microbacterium paraoxydans]|uniref:tape measure protein n=1 Tax=Microbacterium paraoxydans TaxID=199592 RepID=UPI003415A627
MATAVEIANAYVALTVKAPGAKREVEKALGSATGAADGAGRSIGDRLVASASKVIKVGGATIGGILATGIGTALWKGFSRLNAIDTARAKLTGLGNDAGSVGQIMKNALASVRGTAFGLGDAATVAAQAVAAGIKPGRDLEAVLKTVANTAAAAGTDLGEMGSIFSKAMSQANGIQNDVLSQLADKGIPIYAALGKQLGVTAGEVFKLASSGKINFDQFAAAATAAAGTVASEMGNTVGGSWANFIASLGRIGAGLLGGVFPQIAPALQAITAAFGPLEEIAGQVGDKIGQVLAPAAEWFVRALQGKVDVSWIGELWTTLSPVAVLFQALQPILPVVGKAFSDIGSAIGGALVPVLPALVSLMDAVVPLLTTTIVAVLPIVVLLIQGLAAAVSFLAPLILDVVTAVVSFVAANADWISGLVVAGGVIAGVVAAVSTYRAVQAGYAAATYGATAATYASGIAAKVGAAAYAIQNSSLGTLIASLRANEALTLRTKIAIVASTVATNAMTVANKALNVVLRANPIGLIITAVTALVGALVWFFTQTELGKTIWREFTRFLGEAWANISGFFIAAWENVIQPVFQKIGEIATWVYETILKPVFDGIMAVVSFLAAGFKLQFDLIVNAFRLVGAIAAWLWTNALQPAFTAIGAAAAWLWQNAIKPAFEAIGAVVSWLWTTIIQPVFAAIGAIFSWVWTSIILPITESIKAAINAVGAVFEWLYKNIVKPVWDGISGAMKAAWNWINAYVFTPFKVGVSLIGQAFENVAKTIGKAWDGIKKAAAVPINFVLDTVWNKGLRSFWNDMVGTLGLDDMKLPKASLVKFASGGVMPGYTPGRDVHQFWSPTAGGLALSGGEAIMRPEFTRLVGGAAGVDALNAAARNGRLPFGDGEGNLFGDVWDSITKAASVAWEFMTNPAQAIKTHVIEGIIRPLMGGQNLFGRTVGGLAERTLMGFVDLFKAAAPKGVGTKGMGWEAMWGIVQNALPGAVMTSNFRPGARTVNGGQSYHALGRAIDIVPASMATFNAIAKLFPNASELIYTPAGNRQLQNGKPFAGWSEAVRRQHYNHVHLAMASGGVVPKLYDQGGWLPHGGMAVNRSGKPEAVLTNDESLALRRGLGGLADGDQVVIVVEGTPLTGTVRRVLKASLPSAVAVHSALAR